MGFDYISGKFSAALPFPSQKNGLPWANIWSVVAMAILFCVVYAIVFSIIFSAKQKRKNQEERHTDKVTGLLSMDGFEELVELAGRSKKNTKYLLTEMNIRDFANINKIYGSKEGDEILKSIANYLKKKFFGDGKMDKGVFLARGYADNFYIMQPISEEKTSFDDMEILQNNLQFRVGQDRNIHIILKSGSVVCRLDENHELNLRDAISKAGYARHMTKDSIIENFVVYNGAMQAQHENEERIENGIENAFKNNEFVVLYQPKINLVTEKIEGAEALIRWKAKNNALIPPSLFIPVLEQNGMVGILDQYVYKTVFKFLSHLQSENIPPVKISMNMSRLSNNPREFVGELDILQTQYNVDKKYIEVEIEERFAGMGDDFVCELIHSLHESGYQVSMDDFGSGESSLNMLGEMPVDIVKFDQRFLKNAEYSRESRIILAYMIKMVNELGKVTLCEGVETERHVKLLRKCGCRLAQGYYYSKPIPEDEFKKFIVEHI